MTPDHPVDRAYLPPAPETLCITYIDDVLIVAVKPSGLLSVPGRGAEKQASALSYLQREHECVRVVHRLDMDTSGLIVFARSASAQASLSRQFELRHVEKTYEALVDGVPGSGSGLVTLPIGRRWQDRPKRQVDHETGRAAETHWQVISHRAGYSHVQLKPVTGRTHQLRLHMAAIGHPVLGDRLYGDCDSAARLCLHASSLLFAHPGTGKHVRFQSPADFS